MPQQVINGVGRVRIRKASSSQPSSYDTDAQAFITATAITDTTQKNAINDLVLDLKGAGIWTKMKALYPMVGGTASSHKFNLKDPRDLDAAFRLTFYGGVTHSSSGVLGNGVDGYADTFLNMSTQYSDPYDVHLSAYINSDWVATGVAAQAHITALGGLASNRYGFESQITTAQQYMAGVTINKTVTSTTHKGFYCSSVNLITQRRVLFADNTFTNNTTSTVATLPNTTIGLLYRRGTGANNTFSAFGYSFFSAGNKLTTLEQQVFSQIVEKYQYALGRNVGATKSFYFNKDYSNETNAFIYKGEISDAVQISAINTLVNDLKSAGIFTKMLAIYPLVGGTATAHQFNLVTAAIPSAYTAAQDDMFTMVFNGGVTHDANGILGNGTNSYATTNISTGTDLVAGNEHVSTNIYYNVTAESATRPHIGTANNGRGPLIRKTSATSMQALFGSAGVTKTITSSQHIGFWGISRASLTANSGTLLASDGSFTSFTGTNSAYLADSMRLMNSGGSTSNMGYSFFTVGTALTNTELTALKTAQTNFQTTLGRI